MTPNLTPHCSTCRHFTIQHGAYGECRRMPPTARIDPRAFNFESRAWWPIVRNDEWCGEYAERVPTKPKAEA